MFTGLGYVGYLLIITGIAVGLTNFVSSLIQIRMRNASRVESEEYKEAQYHIRFKRKVILLCAVATVSGLFIILFTMIG